MEAFLCVIMIRDTTVRMGRVYHCCSEMWFKRFCALTGSPVWVAVFDQKIQGCACVVFFSPAAKFCPLNLSTPSGVLRCFLWKLCFRWVLKQNFSAPCDPAHIHMTHGASLMKQEYLQVQWKSDVKQSSGFCTCDINIINNIVVTVLQREIKMLLYSQVNLISLELQFMNSAFAGNGISDTNSSL